MTDPIATLAEALWPHLEQRLQTAQARYLTPQQVAERLGVSVPQVRALIRAGEIQAINAGSGDERRAVRVSVQSVEAFERRRAM